MSGFWIVVGAGVGTGLLVYFIGTLTSKIFQGLGWLSVYRDVSNVRRPEPPQTRHPHRPIY